MQGSPSNSGIRRALALLPFGYAALTRFSTPRDMAYMIASSWLPAIWFLFRSSDMSLGSVLLAFAAGYLAFVSVYEIGYFVNDSWDAKRSPGGRRRTGFGFGKPFILGFVAIRCATWLAICYAMQWLSDPIWIAGFAALVLVFALHNFITTPGLRGASFFQLATLRFALPILASTPDHARLLLILAAILCYTYLRFLSYFESKELLVLSERRRPSFGLIQLTMLAPVAALAALISGSWILLELLGYFIALYALWSLIGGDKRQPTSA